MDRSSVRYLLFKEELKQDTHTRISHFGLTNLKPCPGSACSLFVAALLLGWGHAAVQGAAFLENELPLTILQTTPTQLYNTTVQKTPVAINLTTRQALTVRVTTLNAPHIDLAHFLV